MARIKSGGGLTSNKVVHAKAGKTEPRSKAINPGGADQLGAAQAVKRAVVPLEAGAGYSPPVGPTSFMVNGPKGQGRTVSRCGSQGQHGPANYGQAESSLIPPPLVGRRASRLDDGGRDEACEQARPSAVAAEVDGATRGEIASRREG
jgi:hypothetical protein